MSVSRDEFSWRRPRHTQIMGIVNLTPDSFSGDGIGLTSPAERVAAALERAEAMIAAGADILDVGGESTRPGAEPVPVDREIDRVVPVIRALVERLDVPISIDTHKSEVADEALGAGAIILNDITGLQGDPAMARVAARHGAFVVAMHMQGRPRTMQDAPRYADLIGEIRDFLARSVAIGVAAGIPAERIAIDPGIGFGKTIAHNLELLRRLEEIRVGAHAIVLGTSRKRFIGRITGGRVDERVEGTAATVALAIANGVDVVRVHDVPPMAKVARMADAIVRGYDEPADG